MKELIRYNYIAIEGNIGAGKTSLASKIAEEFNARLILEEFEENSFLPKFYSEPERYAFPLELSFLADRWSQLKESLSHRDLFHPFTISDYLVTKSLIFARKTLQEDEFRLYSKLFEIIHQTIPKPDLLVYLYSDINRLQQNIKERGRDYERNITDDYLSSIQDSYFEYIKQQENLRIIIIDTNQLDFVNSEADYTIIKEKIFQDYSHGIHRIAL
jgi:deoxyguanosine kinase